MIDIPEFGELIYRPVLVEADPFHVGTHVVRALDTEFDKTGIGDWTFCCSRRPDMGNKYVANSFAGAGLRCFVKEDIPDDWTYFSIVSISPALTSAVVRPGVTSVSWLCESLGLSTHGSVQQEDTQHYDLRQISESVATLKMVEVKQLLQQISQVHRKLLSRLVEEARDSTEAKDLALLSQGYDKLAAALEGLS